VRTGTAASMPQVTAGRLVQSVPVHAHPEMPLSRSILLRLMLVLGPAGIAAAPAEAIPRQRPNLVLFLVDDLGWADTGKYARRAADLPEPRRPLLAPEGPSAVTKGRQDHPVHAGMIESLGRVLETRDDLELTAHTAVLFVSDNGGLSTPGKGTPRHPHLQPPPSRRQGMVVRRRHPHPLHRAMARRPRGRPRRRHAGGHH
jgi:hypothetical protein